jgi:hypothetical protein
MSWVRGILVHLVSSLATRLKSSRSINPLAPSSNSSNARRISSRGSRRAMIEEFDLEGVGGVTREAFVGICWQ